MGKNKLKMDFKKVAILTSDYSWFVPYAKGLLKSIKNMGYKSRLFFDPGKISQDFGLVFILSYYKIVPDPLLKKHRLNLVVHASDLPRGRGWSPLIWQILEGKNRIPLTLFEATAKMDDGDIYIKDYILLEGHELIGKIREKLASKIIELCLRFLDIDRNLKPVKQKGKISYYPKRSMQDSRLDINKGIREQFNLLRTVDNEVFPAFFCYKGHKYIIKIFREKSHGEKS